MDFNELIEVRRSVRKYVPSAIAKAELEAIVADALNAPSWKNTEATRYYAALADEAKARLWNEALPDFNVTSTANAAALVAVAFRSGESGYAGDAPANELGEAWGAYDAGLASAYFVLSAKNRGWDSLVLGIRDEAKVRAVFGIPDGEALTSVIAVGKAARLPAKNPRKPVAEALTVL